MRDCCIWSLFYVTKIGMVKKKKYQVAYILERNLKLERIVANKMTNKYMIQYEDVINTKEVK